MRTFLKLLSYTFVLFIGACSYTQSSSDTIKKTIEQFSQAKAINFQTGTVLEFIDTFYEADRDMFSQQTVKIYKLGDSTCVANVLYENESGFGGYESLVIFKEGQYIKGMRREIKQIYIESEDNELNALKKVGMEFSKKTEESVQIDSELSAALEGWKNKNFTLNVKDECLGLAKNTLKRVLEGVRLGEDSVSLTDYGLELLSQGETREAAVYLKEALNIRAEKLGKKHPDYLISLKNLDLIARETK